MIGLLWLIRIVVHTWKSVMPSMGLRCGGKAAGDPVYKYQGPEESRILLSVYTYSLLIFDIWVVIDES